MCSDNRDDAGRRGCGGAGGRGDPVDGIVAIGGLLATLEMAPQRAYRAIDARLHRAIAEATGSASLVSAVADVQLRLSDVLSQIPLLQEALRHSDTQHREIIAAVSTADPGGARTAMLAHLAATETLLRGFLSEDSAYE